MLATHCTCTLNDNDDNDGSLDSFEECLSVVDLGRDSTEDSLQIRRAVVECDEARLLTHDLELCISPSKNNRSFFYL